jgi:hypothetical protein
MMIGCAHTNFACAGSRSRQRLMLNVVVVCDGSLIETI